MKLMINLLIFLGAFSAVFAKEAPPACVAIVRIPVPWYAPKFYVKSRMKKSLPEYQSAPGLIYKYFTFGENGTFGGIYLWKDRAAADAWFAPQWIAERSKKYGVELTVPRYDVLAISSADAGAALLQRKFSATLTSYTTANNESAAAVLKRFRTEDAARITTPGLVRTYLVQTEPNRYAEISLWDETVDTEKQTGEKFRVPLAIANSGK